MKKIYLNEKQASCIIHGLAIVISTANRPVESHNSRYGTVDFLCGFFLIHFYISGGSVLAQTLSIIQRTSLTLLYGLIITAAILLFTLLLPQLIAPRSGHTEAPGAAGNWAHPYG